MAAALMASEFPPAGRYSTLDESNPLYAQARAANAARRAAPASQDDRGAGIDRAITTMQNSGDSVLFPKEYERLLTARRDLTNQRAIAPVTRTRTLTDFNGAVADLMERQPFITHDPSVRAVIQSHEARLTREQTEREHTETRQLEEQAGGAIADMGSATTDAEVDSIARRIPARFRTHATVRAAIETAKEKLAESSAMDTIAALQGAGIRNGATAREMLRQWQKQGRWKRNEREYRYILRHFVGAHEPNDPLGNLPGGPGQGNTPAATANADAVLGG